MNESDLAQFRGRGLEPVGRIHGHIGPTHADRKQSSTLMKNILKAMPKTTKPRMKQPRKKTGLKRGKSVERDSAVHGTHKGLGNMEKWF